MMTLAEVSLSLARQVMDVVEGQAASGTATSLTDEDALTQPNGYWEKGTLWILSGAHAGKVVEVSGYSNSRLSFASFGSTVGTPRYAVGSSTLPYAELRKAINQSLEEARVTGIDETLIGNGTDLTFTLPAGARDVYAVEFVDARNNVTVGHHWQERNGKLIFARYAPWPGDIIRVLYKQPHPTLEIFTDVVDDEINLNWLKWQSAVNVLRWAMRVYQNDPTYKFGDFINEALKKADALRPLRRPRVSIRTA